MATPPSSTAPLRDPASSRTAECASRCHGEASSARTPDAPHAADKIMSAARVDFLGWLMQRDIIRRGEHIGLPEPAETMKVLKGGPVDTGRGFVLHSSDFFIQDATLSIDDGICLTATVDILKAIATGTGPKHAILALGYAGWAPGQLENEIQHNGWLHCDADPDLIFGRDVEEKYLRALRKIGIDPGMLSNEAGHA